MPKELTWRKAIDKVLASSPSPAALQRDYGARAVKPTRAFWLIVLVAAIACPGCTAPRIMDKTYRTDKLREMYPAGITSREDVQTRLQLKPDLSAKRPETSWVHHANAVLAHKMPALEEKQGTKLFLAERYLVPDPRSSFDLFSLCNMWFYYDGEEKLVDVEWEWHTD